MSDPDPDLRDLQDAVLTFDPAVVRAALDKYDAGSKEKPWCGEDGSTPLHTICKSGRTHIPPWPSTSPSKTQEGGEVDQVEWEPAPTPPAPPWSGGSGGERHHRLRMCIVYMLCDAGMDVNAVDGCGLTPLHYAARRGDAALCDALLQCGADLEAQHKGRPLWVEVAAAAQREREGEAQHRLSKEEEKHTDKIKDENEKNNRNKKEKEIEKKYEHRDKAEENKEEKYKVDGIEQEKSVLIPSPGLPHCPAQAVCRLFRFYWPGLWRAVAEEDVNKVRQLVNAWCKVDLRRGGMTLLEIAQSTANETITSLLLSIQPSLALVHSCLADNLPAVCALLASSARPRLNLDIRRLSERAAPLLYFVVRAGHHRTAGELCRHGASCLAHMLPDGTGRNHSESAVVFEALEPWLPAEVLANILPSPGSRQAEALARACSSGGGSVLRVAVERGVSAQAVEALVCVGGPALVCERDAEGLSPHDLAIRLGRPHLAQLLDTHTTTWLATPTPHPSCRAALALGGYDRLVTLAAAAGEVAEGGLEEVKGFLEEYWRCQAFLAQVFAAVGEGAGEAVVAEVVQGYHSDTFHLSDVLWRGRLQGDGMPLLHWAVLHGHLAALDLILKPPQGTGCPPHPPLTTRFCPDEVRDPWCRTALHYALALQGGGALAAALLDVGCSEHTLDMYGREPLDFRDVRGSPAMENLLENLRNKVYGEPRPDPWDPEVLRSHLQHLRRQRFHQHHHQHHNHHHHHHHNHHHNHHHHHHHKFPTSPSSDFHWPLPQPAGEEEEEEDEEEEREGGWRVCVVM